MCLTLTYVWVITDLRSPHLVSCVSVTESEPTVRVCDRVCPKLKHDKMIDFKRQFSGTCDSLRLRNSSAEVEAISMLLTSTVSVPLSRTPSPRCSSVYSLLHCYVQYFKKKKVQKSLDVFFCTSCTLNQFIRLTSAMLMCLSTELKSEEKKRIKCYCFRDITMQCSI